MAADSVLKIGTRKSPLAMWQAEYVKDRLEQAHAGLTVELVPIVTKGDKILDVALSKVGGKGLFVKELEVALLAGEVDICVHSTKDMPADLPDGLGLVCFPPRADPRDALVMGGRGGLDGLPEGAKVGTSSLRRQAQLLYRRPDLQIVSVRGNIQTRMKKVEELGLDCVVLACAGIDRMAAEENIGHRFSPEEMLPAAAQGILSIEARNDDGRVLELIQVLDDPAARRAALCERAFLKTLGGGCQVPIAAHATEHDGHLTLHGLVGRPDGKLLVSGARQGAAEHPVALGRALGEDVLGHGGRQVLVDLGLSPGAAAGDLSGHAVVVARDDAPDDVFSLALAARGARVVPLSLMRLAPAKDSAPLERAARGLAGYDALVFTSKHAVHALFERMKTAGTDLRHLSPEALVGAVGAATEQALRQWGVAVDVVGDAGGTALADALAATRSMDGARVLFPRAEDGRDELVEALGARGAQVDVVAAYRHEDLSDAQVRTERALLTAVGEGRHMAWLFLTSPRRAKLCLQALEGNKKLKKINIVAIGQTTADAIRGLGHDALALQTPGPAALIDLLGKAVATDA